MKIEVKQKHIMNGIQGDPCECAVAIAIREQCPALKFYMLEANTLYVGESGHAKEIPVPASVTEFIHKFDGANGDELSLLQPFSFDLPIPA